VLGDPWRSAVYNLGCQPVHGNFFIIVTALMDGWMDSINIHSVFGPEVHVIYGISV